MMTPDSSSPSSSVAPSSDTSEDEVRARLGDRRLWQRMKQIAYGKSTPGYANYTRLVPHAARDLYGGPPDFPVTPRLTEPVSKRLWDRNQRNWRRDLHRWDPPAAADDTDAAAPPTA